MFWSYELYRNDRAHRVAWMLHNKSKVPEGHVICHRCDNPSCVNPGHLYAGTQSMNILESVNKGRHKESKKTHCKNGHEYNAENTRVWRNQRRCRECQRIANRRFNSGIRRKALSNVQKIKR